MNPCGPGIRHRRNACGTWYQAQVCFDWLTLRSKSRQDTSCAFRRVCRRRARNTPPNKHFCEDTKILYVVRHALKKESRSLFFRKKKAHKHKIFLAGDPSGDQGVSTELSEVFGPHRVPGRELSEFLSAYYLCAKENSPIFCRRAHRVCRKTQ